MSILAKKAIKATEQLTSSEQYVMEQAAEAIRQSLKNIKGLPRKDQRRMFVMRSRDAFHKKYGIWIR